jgi:hypothetical protein
MSPWTANEVQALCRRQLCLPSVCSGFHPHLFKRGRIQMEFDEPHP